MAAQGIQLPIYLQIQNLQSIANELKKFASGNILSESLGGKKIDAELTKVLHTLAQIELKSKNAFKVESDFGSLEKDVNKVELSIEHIQNSIKGLKFEDLKIPTDTQDQLNELNAQISALKNNFNSFKAAQKDKLLQNVDFTGSISKAFGKNAGTILEKNYDDMYQAIQKGMNRINSLLIAEKGRFEQNSQILTQNKAGKANYTAWGALEFVQQAFKQVENSGKLNEQQKILSEYMNMSSDTHQFTTWKRGAVGMNGFYKRLAEEFKLEPAQLEQIRKNVQAAAKEAGRTALEEWQKIASDQTEGAKVFGNGLPFLDFKASRDTYANQMKDIGTSQTNITDLEGQANAVATAWRELTSVQQEVATAQNALDVALKAPITSLNELQNSVRSTIINMPELGSAFNQASQEIYNLRQAADVGRVQLANLDQTLDKLQGVSNFVNRYVGIYAVVHKVIAAVKSAFNNIKELDKNITNIAVVTNMSQADLWSKIGEYTAMAQQFGVATKDVYTVSQIFYQQGLQTNQVMSLTTETLKMAKIAGMGYEDAANAMTVAIRAFKIEMTDAQQVTDVYSALAAKFAVSSSEIANAMEKTASSAANVGMTIESTSAFISVMTQTTRESAQNIGSALKSIISRYGEMKASPSALLNIDGEEVAFNKVDTALKSIGISIKDASGQFRDFDDVIMELAQKWDSLDNNTQRYIATIMAGNRQQSRFIALVSNYDELNRAMDTANNAENASIVQVAKTMDSLESKAQQLKNAFSQIYLDLHIEDGLKSAYDWLTRIMKTISKLGILKGAIPTLANFIGIGTGTKAIVNTTKEVVMQHRSNIEKKINLNSSEAEKKAQELQAMLEQEATKRVQVQVDLSQMQAQMAVMDSQLTTKQAEQSSLVGKINTALPFGQSISQEELLKAQKEGQFADKESINKFLGVRNIDPVSDQGKALTGFLEQFQSATTEIQGLTSSITNLKTAIESITNAGKEGAEGMREGGEAAKEGGQNAKEGGDMAKEGGQNAKEGGDNMQQGGQTAEEGGESMLRGGQKGELGGETLNNVAQGTAPKIEQIGNSSSGAAPKIDALGNSAGNTAGKLSGTPTGGSSPKTSDTEFSFKKNQWGTGKGRATASVLSGVARLAGTAIAAAGAAHQDKSTDNREWSKIYTGLGNGLSMAGTGASMGMAFGPWGAGIGAIIGLLSGGLGSIIDGLTHTLKEKIALQKEELETAQNENLKKQADATDLSGAINNLKSLKKAMYNSTEDMQAYKDAMNTLAEQYPNLVSTYDEAGNAIIDLNSAEQALASIRLQGAQAARQALIKEGELHTNYKKAIDIALEAVTNQKGSTATGTYAGGYNSSSAGTSFTLKNESGAEKEYRATYESTQTNNGAMLDYVKIDYKAALEEASQKVFRKGVEQLTTSDFEELVNNLIENPELGGQHQQNSKIDWLFGRYNTISNKQWENYKNNYVSGSGSNFVYDVSQLDQVIEEYSAIFDGAKSVRQLLKLSEGTDITITELELARQKIENAMRQNNIILENLDKSSGYALGQENLYNTALSRSDLNTDELMRLQENNIYSKIYSQMMEDLAKGNNYKNNVTWYSEKPNDFQNQAKITAESFIDWYNTLTKTQKEALEAIDFTEYTSVDDMLSAAGIRLDGEDKKYKALQEQFIESNAANRDRILTTIFTYDTEGKVSDLNYQDMGSLLKINDNYALDMAYGIGRSGAIISKYSDFFTDQLVNINSLAEEGYTELATTRLTSLHDLYTQLSNIKDSKIQNDLFKTITNIDFTNYDSIISASQEITKYGAEHEIDVSGITNSLVEASNNLIFNINTLASDLTNGIISAAKEIDSILTTNKNGLSLDKALEEFNKLSSIFDDVNNFDDIFTYDASLGKYIYNTQGLQKAIAAKEQKMSDNAEQLANMSKIYTEQITSVDIDEEGNKTYTSKLKKYSNENIKYTSKDDLMDYLRSITQLSNKQVAQTYENLANDFIKDDSYQDKTFSNFIEYIELKAKENDEQAEVAQKILQEYKNNTKNQLYAAIDWSKLALGTDYTGSNKQMLESLGKELGLLIDDLDEKGNVIGQHWVKGYTGSWEGVLNKYFDTVYTDDKAKKAAKAAVKGQIAKSKSDQISTAINEVLNGYDSILSESTLALVQDREDLTIVDGVISTGDNFVKTAIDLYKTYSLSLLTLADKNTAYSSILNKSFEQPTQAITALSSAASMDISTLSDTFTKFGKELAEFYDAEVGAWQGGLELAMKTDAFGNTQISDWNLFLEKLNVNLSNEVLSSFEYRNAYSSYVDGLITLDTQILELIHKNYDNAFSSITEWKPINISELADSQMFKSLAENGIIDADAFKQGQLVVKDAVKYAQNISDWFITLSAQDSQWLYENMGWTPADLAKNWKNAQTVITQMQDTWTSLAENISSLSTDNIGTLVEKGNFSLSDLTSGVFTKIGDTYALKLDEYKKYLVEAVDGEGTDYTKLSPNLQKKVDEAYNKAEQAIVNKINGLEWSKVLDGTATAADQDTFTKGLQESLASLGMSLSTYYNASGALDISTLINALKILNTEVANTIANNIAQNVAETRDTMLNELSNNADILVNGTNNQADITKFVQRYNKLTGSPATANQLFEYDDILQSYTLTTAAFILYSQEQKKQLENIGISNDYITQYLKDQAQQLVGQEMDITGFLTGTDLSSDGQAARIFINQLTKWKAIQGEELTQTLLNSIMKDLTLGGENAVERLKELKGVGNVTADDITAVYRAQVIRLQEAASQLAEASIGSIITGDLVNIFKSLNENGFKVKDLGNGAAVVEAIGNMANAYGRIYQQMVQSADATTAELNAACAQMLTAAEQNDIDAIDAMNNAMGMTYDALGQILAKSGEKLADWLANEDNANMYERIGAGKIRITDFKAFAEQRKWVPGSEEYTTAFKAYNDSLIELDRKTSKDIAEEIKSISDAKTGDKVNITYLTEAIEGGEDTINTVLENMGATVADGILKIVDGAQIGAIVTTLANLAQNNGQLITAELAELADAVEDFIDSIISAIKSGISGNLKNSEANTLKEWAKTYANIGDLDFTRTAEGLQLSEQSAIQLYTALKKVDSVKASLVFDELSDSLQRNNDNFKSVSALMGHIKNISEGIYAADEKVSSARLAQYEAELEVAKEILAVRSTKEDDSFNFMSNKIPGAQNNPLNYLKNWSQAFQAINDAFTVEKNGATGFIGYEDWYNIATEINNMAAVTGQEIKLGALTFKGDLESASTAIQAGADSLTAVDTGELKVNLASVGIGIQSGADALTSGIEEGIHGIAEAQVQALDGLIAMLELIVAMEQLGDIDVDENGIDLSDLFKVTYDSEGNVAGHDYTQFSEDYKKWVENIKDKINKDSKNYNKDLANAVEGIKIDGIAFKNILDWTPAQFNDAANESVAQAYAAMLNAFNKAALSGNYDLDNIQQSVLQVLSESGFNDTVTLDIGDMTYVISAGTMTTINWADTDTDAILTELAKKYDNDKKKAREELTTWIQAYGKGELEGETELNYVLLTKKKITMENGKVTSVTYGGKTYNLSNSSQTEIDAAVNSAVLEDFGFDTTNRTVDAETGAVTVKTKIGNVEVDVESNNGQVRLIGPHGKYKNQAEFLDKEWEYVARDHGWIDEHGENARHYDSQKEWQWGEYRIPTKITPKFNYQVDEGNKKQVDPSNDSNLRAKLTEIITGGRKSIQDLIDNKIDHDDGTYTVDLGEGYTFTFTGGTDPTTALEQAIGEQLGIDVALSNTISTAIANAFASDTVQSSVSEAISKGMQNAIKGSEGETTEIPLPAITLKPTEINIDTSGVNAENAISTEALGINLEALTATITSFIATSDPNELVNNLTGTIATYSGEGDPNALVGALEAIITSFGKTADPNDLVKALSATIIAYNNGGDPNSLTNALSALVTVYTNGGDPDALVKALTAYVTTYINGGTPDNLVNTLHAIIESFTSTGDPNLLVNALTAVITTYINGGDPSNLVNGLIAYITEYNDTKATKPTLEDLVQFINEINTSGADAALAAWRAQQESQAITIPVASGQNSPSWEEEEAAGAVIRQFEQEAYEAIANTGTYDLSQLSPERAAQIGQAYATVRLPEYDKYIDPNAFVNRTSQAAEMLAWDLSIRNEFITPKNITGVNIPVTGEVEELDTSEVENEKVSLEGEVTTNTPQSNGTTTTTTDTSSIDSAADALAAAGASAETAGAAAETFGSSAQSAGESATDAASNEDILANSEAIAGANAASAGANLDVLSGSTQSMGSNASSAAGNVSALGGAMRSIPGSTSHSVRLNISASVTSTSGKGTVSLSSYSPSSLTAISFAKGNKALAGGQSTLMGELGPELVVSNGHYFVVGQNGAEFVDLAPDAIVFNHKQTASLLNNGKSSRGKPITNENNAISWAKGNLSGGPAMASAAAALAALKQLRSEWQALANLSLVDLAKKGGGGGGGGSDKVIPGFMREVERWYNWLQKIADLEKQITYQEKLRSKIQSDMVSNGKAYYASQRKTYEDARASALTSESLFLQQKEYFNMRRQMLSDAPISSIYTFDETGQAHYKDEEAREWMEKLFTSDKYGQMALTPKQQYQMILARNPALADYMKYDKEGKEIKKSDYKQVDEYYLAMVEAFSDRLTSEQEEMQELFDSWNDQQQAVLEQMQAMNEQLQAMKDNQKEVENAVLDAIVESREREIQAMEDTRDAIEQTNEDFIDGLNKSLDKERQMYEGTQKDQELERNRRQLAILKRSGASASQISQLQEKVDQQARDQYFEKQQEQIDAVKEASDLQLEKMNTQIELAQEQLEYEKANGLLWGQVYQVMSGSASDIANFIKGNTEEWWSKSPLASADDANKIIFQAEQWKAFSEDTDMQNASLGKINQNLDVFMGAMKEIYGKDVKWDEIEKTAQTKYEALFGPNNDDPGSTAWQAYQSATELATTKPAISTTSEKTNTTTAATTTGGGKNGKEKAWSYNKDYHYHKLWRNGSWSMADKAAHDFEITSKKDADGVFNGKKVEYYTVTKKCKICGYTTTEKDIKEAKNINTAATAIDQRSINKTGNGTNTLSPGARILQAYASGGKNEYTGLAILHGTSSEPEGILNAEDYKAWKQDIKTTNLLYGALANVSAVQRSTAAAIGSTTNNETGINIENAVVNMNTTIANDYDARRAGEQALEQMLTIARKSGTRSAQRR